MWYAVDLPRLKMRASFTFLPVLLLSNGILSVFAQISNADSPIIPDVFGDRPVTPLNGNSSLPAALRFPNFKVPHLETRLLDQALKAAQRRLVDTLSLEDQFKLVALTGNSLPNTAADLFNVESQLHPDAKRNSAIGYVLEGMTRYIANRSQLTREQIIFGLPKLPVAHPTISRRCPYTQPASPCEAAPFRNTTGLCNNVQNPWWGTPMSPFSRFLPHAYADAVREIRKSANDTDLPNARFVSATMHWPMPGLHAHVTQMLAVWTQFVEQDVSQVGSYFATDLAPLRCCENSSVRHPECFPVEADTNDSFYQDSDLGCMNYARSIVAPKLGCVMGPRDQANQVTHFLDGSTIYGSTDLDNKRLREGTGGRLWMTDFENGKSLLPEAVNSTDCRAAQDAGVSCFDSGNFKVNEMLSITAIYTLFAREHNRIVDQLAKQNALWDDELLYLTARKIVIAQIQHITFSEYLPLVLGKDSLEKHNIQPVDHGFYHGYSSDVNPSVTNEFAVAAVKFWHALVDNRTEFIDRRGRVSWKSLNAQWYQPYDLYFAGVLDGVVRGLSVQPTRLGDQSITPALTASWLRVTGSNATGLDIAALSIQRGRDHGLAGYNSWRDACGLPKAKSFDDLRDTITASNIGILKVVYGSVDDIDLYTGGLSETHSPGSLVGPVFGCIIGKQFHNSRRADRYWYELDMPESGFSLDQLNEIRKTSLARIICNNADSIGTLQPRVMLQPDNLLNAPVQCKDSTIPSINLKVWQDGMPNEPEYSSEILMNIVEKAREAVTNAAADEIARSQSRTDGGKARVPFNQPTESVRLLHLESSAFLQSTKHLLKRELNRPTTNLTDAMARILRFNGLIKAKNEIPLESSNCTERVTPCDHTSKYRTSSGWCNNLNHPDWGCAERIYGRTLDPVYSDGVDEPRNMSVVGIALPSPRDVQVAVVTDIDRPHPLYTHLLMNFGQFLDHDVTLTPIATALNGFNFNCRSCDAQFSNSPNCRPMSIPDSDTSMPPFLNDTTKERRCLAFIRSSSGRTAFGTREQTNQNTAYMDGSQIYGSSLCKTQRLRSFTNGRLNVTIHSDDLKDLLPQTIDQTDVEALECKNRVTGNACFLAGDTRENENPGLTVAHTIWMRYHNKIADELHRLNPAWSDERLFQESRRIINAVFQHIAFNEYLPRVHGQAVHDTAGLRLLKNGYYHDYEPTCDATIANEFAAAAYRFGHTLVRGEFGRFNNDLKPANVSKLNLFEHFARGDVLYEDYGVDQLLIGFTVEPMQQADHIVTKSLTDRLFEDPARKFSGQDLIAINIMRGRDHGLPGYNDFREHCNLTRAKEFSDLTTALPADVVAAMQTVYQHVDDIDLYVAGISEYPVYGGVVGPTFACLIGEQFYRMRKCDRFWYETSDRQLRFSEDQLSSIRKITLAKVLCDNSDTIDQIQRSVLDMSDQYMNPYVRCDSLPAVDLTLWQEKSDCNISGTAVPLGHTARITPCMSCTCTKEGTIFVLEFHVNRSSATGGTRWLIANHSIPLHAKIDSVTTAVGDQYATNTWTILRTSVQDILQKKTSSVTFEELYQHVYGMSLHQQGNFLHDNLQLVITEHLSLNVRGDLLKAVESNFLHGLKQVWENFSACMLIIKEIFMYMDRRMDHTDSDQSSVYAMGLTLFRDTVLHYGEVREKLQRTLLDLIAQERAGIAIDQATVRAVCTMLIELGGDSRVVYEEDFEQAYLAESTDFFRAEAQKFLALNSAGEFVRNVERLTVAETERINHYLDKSTKAGIDKLIDEELIQKHMDTVVNMPNGGVVALIHSRNFSEMAAMFKAFNRISDGVSGMLVPISQYLRQQGTTVMGESNAGTKNPVQLIQSLLDLKKEYDLFLDRSFKKDQRFRRMVAADFEYFFNLNKRAPELLSLFIDEQLKNGNKNMTEAQMNSVLDQAMTLFRYLHEKDVFERFYKHHLARRLLASRTTSDDSEKAMLAKLRHECGYSFTSKLEGMYRDILVSATFHEKFKDHCFQAPVSPIGSIDLSVQVLTTGFWPMPAATAVVALPNDVQKAFMEFRKLYLDTHNGRQLTLQNNLGTAEITVEFYGTPLVNDKAPSDTSSHVSGKVRKHVLHVTTYQMSVLLLFNQQNEWSYPDLLAVSGVPEKDLKRTLATLSTGKLKIILKIGGGKSAETASRFIINDSFYSPLYRMKVNTGVKLDFKEDLPDEETRDAKDKYESDRRHEVDAAIIRIMKGRQQLDHSELVAELTAQLRNRFTPSMDVIKKSIESLIAKDYLSRSEENRSLYRYVA